MPTPEKATPSVRIISNGTEKSVSYMENMTIADAAREAEINIPFRSKLFVNDRPAERSSILQPGDIVTIAPRARNGA